MRLARFRNGRYVQMEAMLVHSMEGFGIHVAEQLSKLGCSGLCGVDLTDSGCVEKRVGRT